MASPKVEQNRAAKIAAIKQQARTLVAERGAASLSLREVARVMEQTSSALYRYFPNRDALLTALIVDAYNDLGAVAEASVAASIGHPPLDRLVALACAIREWARSSVHEYALIFGTPIPNYVAPEATIAPAARIPYAFAATLGSATPPHRDFGPGGLPSGTLDLDALSVVLGDLDPDATARALLIWSSVFGLLTFELFGHFVGSVENAETYFRHAVAELGIQFGLEA